MVGEGSGWHVRAALPVELLFVVVHVHAPALDACLLHDMRACVRACVHACVHAADGRQLGCLIVTHFAHICMRVVDEDWAACLQLSLRAYARCWWTMAGLPSCDAPLPARVRHACN